MQLKPGIKLGPYEIIDLLGLGGMGEVYSAQDPRLGREVAVKYYLSNSREMRNCITVVESQQAP